MLDQFYLEDHPGGPDEGWPKWCEDGAIESACVLIVASEGWFATYDKSEPPGQGLGAATEADLFRQEIWNQRGYNERIRLIVLHQLEANKMPIQLRSWHHFRPFDAPGPDEMIRWLRERLRVEIGTSYSSVQWPVPIQFQPDIADRIKEWHAAVDLLAGSSKERVLLLEGGSGVGKSQLARQSAQYARKLSIPVALIDFKGGTLTTDDVLEQIDLEIGALLPNFSQEQPKKSYTLRKDLRALRQPMLFIFDSYEDAAENQNIVDWLNVQFLGDLASAPAVAVIIAGQKTPERANTNWRELARHFSFTPITELVHWKEWASRRYPNVQEGALDILLKATGGQPSLMTSLCEGIAKSE